MDITKLFEISDEKRVPLEAEKLESMIDRASAYPQIQTPANENAPWIRRALAVAAAIALVVAVSLQFAPPTQKDTDTVTNDAYSEISDLLILETLSDQG